MSKKLFTATLVLVAVAVLLPGISMAVTYTLVDDNSVASISNEFFTDWDVDGVDQLFEQDFFYRTGSPPSQLIQKRKRK